MINSKPMFYLNPDEIKLKHAVEQEIQLDSARRRGPKRNGEKIFTILLTIMRNDLDGFPALSTQRITEKLVEFNINDIEEYLQFLTKFPKHAPFLEKDKVYRESVVDGKKKKLPGGPSNVYHVNAKWAGHVGRTNYTLDAIFD